MSKDMHLTLGPPVPVVPLPHFTRVRFTRQQLEDAWRLCGPTFHRNITRVGANPMHLWQAVAMTYLEGLHHGAAIAAGRDGGADGVHGLSPVMPLPAPPQEVAHDPD